MLGDFHDQSNLQRPASKPGQTHPQHIPDAVRAEPKIPAELTFGELVAKPLHGSRFMVAKLQPIRYGWKF